MAAMAVDTLSLARELRAASVAPEQAEAIAAAIGRAVLEGAATKADLTSAVSDLRKALAEQLPNFMAPRELRVVDALPRTPLGKVVRNALRMMPARA